MESANTVTTLKPILKERYARLKKLLKKDK